MDNREHEKNISFLREFFRKKKFKWINYGSSSAISYFSSGGGTHLYIIENKEKKFLARINFYPGKNSWGVKKVEYQTLKKIENLSIAPKVFLLNEENSLNQHFTIVEYIEGKSIKSFSKKEIFAIARDLKKLHNFPIYFNKNKELPYSSEIYDEFANGEDKKIENYSFENIENVFEKYNDIKKKLGRWFLGLTIFKDCQNLCLCHGDLKRENILQTKKDIMIIDWECAGLDIPETDIARLFSGCNFTKNQQSLFLDTYYEKTFVDKITLQRIASIKIVLDFFNIIRKHCIINKAQYNAQNMLKDLMNYEKKLKKLMINN